MGVGGPGLWCAQEAERRKQARRRWKPYIYVNGVSVYLERQGDKNDRSFMTSHIVHAPPELCKDEVAPPSPPPPPAPLPLRLLPLLLPGPCPEETCHGIADTR